MWSKIKTGIGITIALLMLSSVTIFHPKDITENILMKLISLPEPQVIEPFLGHDRPLEEALRAVSADSISNTVKTLSSYTSRVVGYAGADSAYEYLKAEFEEIGLEDIRTETFPVTVPMDKGSKLTVLETGEEIPLHALWPNLVRTPTTPREGLTGPIVYGGKGEFGEFNGYDIQGSVVLMDFDSQDRFINARMLGASAIVFFDNGRVTRSEAELKFMGLPLNVPRYWVDKAHVPGLLELAESGTNQVNVQARMDWEVVEGKNIFGWIPGLDEEMPNARDETRTKWKDYTIVIESYYDAMSVVPGLAPGAESATGVAAPSSSNRSPSA